MKKINARIKPAEKKEVGKISTKPFKCRKCACIEYIESVEFGEDIRCPECGAKMYEMMENGQKQPVDSDGVL